MDDLTTENTEKTENHPTWDEGAEITQKFSGLNDSNSTFGSSFQRKAT
jgi:hypothetical protein